MQSGDLPGDKDTQLVTDWQHWTQALVSYFPQKLSWERAQLSPTLNRGQNLIQNCLLYLKVGGEYIFTYSVKLCEREFREKELLCVNIYPLSSFKHEDFRKHTYLLLSEVQAIWFWSLVVHANNWSTSSICILDSFLHKMTQWYRLHSSSGCLIWESMKNNSRLHFWSFCYFW